MKSLLFALLLLAPTAGQSQDIRRLEPGQAPAHAQLSQFAWLTGYWVGSGLGGRSEELWMPAADSSMAGIFRQYRGDGLWFSEYMMITSVGGAGTRVRLKHFNRDGSPWEEKDRWVEFPLVAVEPHTAWFNGLTYHRSGDTLTVKLAFRNAQGPTVETFTFHRQSLD